MNNEKIIEILTKTIDNRLNSKYVSTLNSEIFNPDDSSVLIAASIMALVNTINNQHKKGNFNDNSL